MKAGKVAQMVKLVEDGVPIHTVVEIIITLEPNKQRLANALCKFFLICFGYKEEK